MIGALDGGARPAGPRAPLVGRDAELDLLLNTFTRTVRDGRAYLFTIFGEPGVGKSRLAREFVDGLERASVLSGRCLPYGEGVTYWPLAEMIKSAAGITDDDPLEEAFEKLRACCEEETVADVLGLAAGMLEALEGDRSPQEIAWAARQVMESLGDVQPLVLLFEDIHWAEEPMLDLIEHLADLVRTPLLILCLARPELLEQRPGWGGGRVRSTAIELEPLSEEESELLVEKLVGQLAGASGEIPPSLPKEVLDRTEGNPLFVEEMIRMLVESDARDEVSDGIPDSLQALIAARIDHLPLRREDAPPAGVRRGARVLEGGDRVRVARSRGHRRDPRRPAHARVPAPRAAILDLRREGVSLQAPAHPRGGVHEPGQARPRAAPCALRRVARRARRGGTARDPCIPPRPGGRVPDRARRRSARGAREGAAAALVKGARRAMAREAYATARKLASRSQELHPSLSARYLAARAAWRLADLATVEVEMQRVRDEAALEGNRVIEAIALTSLGEAKLRREADPAGAQVLVDHALEILAAADDPAAHFDALSLRVTIAAWRGDVDAAVRDTERAYGVAMDSGRKDLQTIASQALATLHLGRLELDEAELAITRALELAGESGSVRARIGATFAYGHFLRQKGELEAAETIYEEVRQTAAELGLEHFVGYALFQLGALARRRGDVKRAEKLLREATRSAAARGDRGFLPEAQAQLACALVEAGRLEEAERLALEAVAGVGPEDPSARMAATGALGHVRAAQGRDAEAEELIREALAIAQESPFTHLELEPLELLADFLHTRGRDDEAMIYGRGSPTSYPSWSSQVRANPASRGPSSVDRSRPNRRRPPASCGSPGTTPRPETPR